MINFIKNKKGVTIVEVVIAMGFMVILFSIFAMIITNAYRVNVSLDRNKSAREEQVKQVEHRVGANKGKATDTGDVEVKLDFSNANLSETKFGAAYATAEKVYNCNIYISGDYGVDENGNPGDKYIYVYGQ